MGIHKVSHGLGFTTGLWFRVWTRGEGWDRVLIVTISLGYFKLKVKSTEVGSRCLVQPNFETTNLQHFFSAQGLTKWTPSTLKIARYTSPRILFCLFVLTLFLHHHHHHHHYNHHSSLICYLHHCVLRATSDLPTLSFFTWRKNYPSADFKEIWATVRPLHDTPKHS